MSVVNFRPDTSFPYLAIARHFRVPYEKVMAIVWSFDRAPSWDALYDETDGLLFDTTYRAWMSELRRRQAEFDRRKKAEMGLAAE